MSEATRPDINVCDAADENVVSSHGAANRRSAQVLPMRK
jgi:hypothetical protein